MIKKEHVGLYSTKPNNHGEQKHVDERYKKGSEEIPPSQGAQALAKTLLNARFGKRGIYKRGSESEKEEEEEKIYIPHTSFIVVYTKRIRGVIQMGKRYYLCGERAGAVRPERNKIREEK